MAPGMGNTRPKTIDKVRLTASGAKQALDG
jgi:hypothetical protein